MCDFDPAILMLGGCFACYWCIFFHCVDGLYHFVCFWSGSYWLFLSLFSASFRSSCKAGPEVMKSLSSCLSIKDFLSPSLMKLSLAGYDILGWKFFPLRILNIGPYSLLACRVSAERSPVSLMGFPLWVSQPFSLAALSIFSFISGKSDEYVPWGCSSWGISLWCSLYYLGLNIDLPCYVGEVFLDNILKSIFQLGFIRFVTFRYTYQT